MYVYKICCQALFLVCLSVYILSVYLTSDPITKLSRPSFPFCVSPACCNVSKTGGRSVKYSLESNVPISERSDDQSWSVTKVLITVLELSITDVSKAMTLALIPPEVETVKKEKGGEGEVRRQRRRRKVGIWRFWCTG